MDQLGGATIYIYIYAHILAPPLPTTRKNAHFANLSLTVIRQRLRKSKNPKMKNSKIPKIQNSKNPKIQKSKTFHIYGILQVFFGFWDFGNFGIFVFSSQFWNFRVFFTFGILKFEIL